MDYGSDGGIDYAGIIMTCETLTFYTVQQCIAIKNFALTIPLRSVNFK